MSKKTVLIVEDSPTQAKQIAAIVSSVNATAIIAGDGLEALQMVEHHHPDVIILDVNLPKMDGVQVCNRLKRDSDTATIPVIMLTAASSAKAAIHGLTAGADDYIPKDTFAMDHLVSTLRAYFRP